MPRPDCRSLPAKDTPQVSMPWHFPQIARAWQPEASTVRSGCIVRRTARSKRASYQYRFTEVGNDIDVAGVARDGLGVDGLGVDPRSTASDHRIAAARSAKGQALQPDARRQESRRRREDSLDDAGVLHIADSRSASADAGRSDAGRGS